MVNLRVPPVCAPAWRASARCSRFTSAYTTSRRRHVHQKPHPPPDFFTHLFTPPPPHSLIHSLTPSLPHPFTHSFTHSLPPRFTLLTICAKARRARRKRQQLRALRQGIRFPGRAESHKKSIERQIPPRVGLFPDAVQVLLRPDVDALALEDQRAAEGLQLVAGQDLELAARLQDDPGALVARGVQA